MCNIFERAGGKEVRHYFSFVLFMFCLPYVIIAPSHLYIACFITKQEFILTSYLLLTPLTP